MVWEWTTDGTVVRKIGNEGRTSEDMAKGGTQGERPRLWEVGQIREYNEGSVLG